MIIQCFIDDRTHAILQRISMETGRTIEQLAEAAIESEAIAALPDGQRGMHFDRSLPLNLGSVTIGMVEQGDGSIRFVP